MRICVNASFVCHGCKGIQDIRKPSTYRQILIYGILVHTGKSWFKESTKRNGKWIIVNCLFWLELKKNSRHEFLPHIWEFCCSKVPFHYIAAGFNTMQFAMGWNNLYTFISIQIKESTETYLIWLYTIWYTLLFHKIIPRK